MIVIHNEKATITVKEFAEQLNISLPTAYALTNEPGFPLLKIGRKKLVIASGLNKWIAEHQKFQAR